ncbi:CopG family transcriptional regulator [Gordonia sp. (in: high G+C Gram-positive bacteria)]|uniref:CopG family transcriptional regulator n=1 Tax=Gordonia sp. (in: high G+C Gram-positive bacteria) TaxID=84139 RepID=UPI003C7958A9
MSKSRNRLEQALAEAADIEESPDRVVRTDVVTTRGGRRTRTLQVRFNEDGLADLEALARARDLPVSTVARDILLTQISQIQAAPNSPLAAIDEAIEALTHLREMAVVRPSR